MNRARLILLSSSAAIIAFSTANAADLPLKAKAVEYVKVCSLYGAGFYYIPGTDTCMRIGGYLRAEVTYNGTTADQGWVNGAGGEHSRLANKLFSRARIMVHVDTRTATEYGVVRTYGAFGPQFTVGADTPGNGGMRVEAAFVQFAGFTFGRSASAYALPWNASPGNIASQFYGGPNYDGGVNNAQYTWQFGNGVSASIGLDQQSLSNRTQILNTGILGNIPIAFNGTQTANYYAAPVAADIVGRIRLDQAWGLLQFSAAAHQVNASYYDITTEASGHPDDKWGFAVTGALQIKNLPTGPGDDIKITATYADGATRYVLGQSTTTNPNFAVFGRGSDIAYNSLGIGSSSDATFGNSGALELTKAFGMNAAFNHHWNKHWTTSIFGSYSSINYNAAASAMYCASYGLATGHTAVSLGGTATCNPDFNIVQVGLMGTWQPVKNLTFYLEGFMQHIDTGFSGTTTLTTTGSTIKPSGAAYTFKDQNVYSGEFRVQRNF